MREGNHSHQVASGSSSWAVGVEPCPLSSKQPLRLLTQACGIDIRTRPEFSRDLIEYINCFNLEYYRGSTRSLESKDSVRSSKSMDGKSNFPLIEEAVMGSDDVALGMLCMSTFKPLACMALNTRTLGE